jgi:acyl-CoA dehydrogenase
VVHAVEDNDVPAFRKNLLGWIFHFMFGFLRTFFRGATRGLFVSAPGVAPETRTYYRRLGWAAAHFGTLTDLAMFTMGGKLKAKGKLTGRYADAVAWQLLAISALRRYEADGRRKEDLPLLAYSVEYALNQVQIAFEGIYANFDAPVLGFFMRTVGAALLRVNRLGHEPTDRISHKAAKTVQTYNDQFKRLSDGVFVPAENTLGLGQLMKAFRLTSESQPVVDKVISAQKARTLPRGIAAGELADAAHAAGLIDADEAALLKQAHAARTDAIAADVFTSDQFYSHTVSRPTR